MQHSGATRTRRRARKAAKPKGAPRGYLISSYYCSKSQLDYVDGVLARVPGGCTEAQRRFWLHVMISRTVRRRYTSVMTPVASALMREKLPDCPHKTEDVWSPLVEAGLLEVDDEYSIVKGETREFAVPDPLTLAFLEAGATAENKTAYELFSGKRTRSPKRAEKTTLKDENGHRYPALVDAVLRHFQTVRRKVNRTAIERHLDIRQADHDAVKRTWVAAGSPGYDCPEREDYLAAQGVLVNDRHCFEVVQKQDFRYEGTVNGDEIWSYVPAYEVQTLSGRLTEKLGGLQSASRPMKGASVIGFIGDPGTGYTNYDIVSSQLYALLQAFEEAAIDTAPIVALLGEDKADLAARIGVTVDTYKACLYALLFHASLFPSLDVAYEKAPGGALVEAILDDPTETPAAAYRKLYEVMSPLRKGLKAWHRWLTTTYWKRVRRKSRGWYAVNDCGVTFRPDDYAEGHERKSKMAAWYLQGKEACYVHHITLLGPKYGYTVVANEHDGVLVDAEASDGEIPPEAIAEALDRANFKYAQLITKPIGRPLWRTQRNSTSSTIADATTDVVTSPITNAKTDRAPAGRTSAPPGAPTTSTTSSTTLRKGRPRVSVLPGSTPTETFWERSQRLKIRRRGTTRPAAPSAA